MNGPARTLAAYYRCPDVRARIAEYSGATAARPGKFSALGFAGYGGRLGRHEPDGAPEAIPDGALPALLDEGADVCRSLADRRGTLVHLDIDYADPEHPADAYRRPEDCFDALEPVHDAVRAFLRRHGASFLDLMTGRGYHFVCRAPRGSPFERALVRIGTPVPPLGAGGERGREDARNTGDRGRAHEGTGRLLEYLAQQVIRQVQERTDVPVGLADLPPPGGGPFVCLDLTAYADPLVERYVRCAFSANQKAWMGGIAPERPFVIALPRGERSVRELLDARQDTARAGGLAAGTRAAIPDVADAPGWVEGYEASPLALFHRAFDRGPEMAPEAWPYTYDTVDLAGLPACAGHPLAAPNPALLKPLCLRSVALSLWRLGWHPRSIAGFVRSRYERDHGWGGLWRRYDAAARAAFYVRLFCGAVAGGVDTLEGFTCESQRLRGACEPERCGFDLGALGTPLGHDDPTGRHGK